jgi:hypothetical protein
MARKFAKVAKPSAYVPNKVVETTVYPLIRFKSVIPLQYPTPRQAD